MKLMKDEKDLPNNLIDGFKQVRSIRIFTRDIETNAMKINFNF